MNWRCYFGLHRWREHYRALGRAIGSRLIRVRWVSLYAVREAEVRSFMEWCSALLCAFIIGFIMKFLFDPPDWAVFAVIFMAFESVKLKYAIEKVGK